MICRHYQTCPGCPLIDETYDTQRLLKGGRLRDALSWYPQLHLKDIPEVLGATHTEAYRHRLKLPVDVQRDGVAVGLYHPRTHAVLDTPDCPVLVAPLRQALGVVRDWLKDRRGVHAIDLRYADATGALQLVIACDGASLKGGKAAVKELRARLPALSSVAVSMADPERKRVMGRSPEIIDGDPFIVEGIGEARYRLHPGAFFQADPRNAAQLHGIVREMVGDAQTVLDLYAGVGAYALALAPGRKRVVAVEEVPQAARAAREMAPDNVEVVTSKVEDLDFQEPFDVAILNPARRGSDLHTLARVAQLAERIVYVSCGPEALARDLDVLAAYGMRVKEIRPIDLFPQTAEVETVVHLTRGPALTTWAVHGGRATGPTQNGGVSGAVGQAREALALVVHDPGSRGYAPGARWERLGLVASHALIRLQLDAPVEVPLRLFAQRGHPVAGHDPRTARFFAEKAGLQRPFVHITRTDRARAPLHGDLAQALISLGAESLLERLDVGP